MIPELGLVCLILALMMAVTLAAIAPIGLISHQLTFLQRLSRPAAYGQCLFVFLSFLTLMRSFVLDDFSIQYIAQNSNANLPTIYKFCALWGAHEGSLLLWALILALWTFAVARYSRRLPANIAVCVMAVLGTISVGFLLLLLHTSNPFLRLLPFSATEGADLNPLLQDPGFVLHPPFLYMGYVGFAVPFAFAITAMIFKDRQDWCIHARPFALLAWSFLTLGITLGSWWAYYELGWGGWWFWDPVENASFMPWLVGAALGHALLVSPRHVIFNSWSVLLALSAFILSLVGTFLVRSGVVSSVHAFASDPLRGTFILCFLVIVTVFSFVLFVSRVSNENSQKLHWLSRESWILLGNVIFFVATCTVLLGTLYPIMMEVLFQERLSVGPPYFNAVFVPIMMPLLLLMALAPHLQWQENKLALFWLRIKKPIFIFTLGLIATLYLLRYFPLLTLMGLAVGLWIVWGTLLKLGIEFKNSYRFPSVARWGMIIAHLGLGIAVLGITLTTSLSTEKEMKMAPGESAQIEGYQFIFQAISPIQGSNFEGLQGHFTIEKNKKIISQLYPEKRFFIPRRMPMTETAISPGLWRDFYIALGEKLEDDSWTVRFYIKPFVRWIWLGGILISVGAFISSLVCFRRTLRGET